MCHNTMSSVATHTWPGASTQILTAALHLSSPRGLSRVKRVELCATNFQEKSERERESEREKDKKGCYHHPGNYPGGNYLFLEHACNKLWTTITTWEVSRGVMFAALLVTLLSVALLSVTTAILCYLKHNNFYIRSEVLTAVSITVRLFWYITLCTSLNRYRHFEAV